MGTSYNNFFLFDGTLEMSNYKAKLLKDYYKYIGWNESQLKVVKKYLDYLSNYYTKVMKEAKKHRDQLFPFLPIL